MKDEKPDDRLDDALREAIAALPREIQPQRDLWPGIAARIAPRRRFARYWPAAAAIALVAIGAAVGTAWFDRATVPAPAVQQAFVAAPAANPRAPAVMPRNPRALALAASVRQSTRMDPKTQAVLLRNLAIIENSLDNIQQALRQAPDDAGLQQLLYQMYRSEAALLDAAQRVQLQSSTGVVT